MRAHPEFPLDSANLMRIRTKASGEVSPDEADKLWAEVSANTRHFKVVRVLDADYIVLTNIEGKIVAVVNVTGIKRRYDERGQRYLSIEGFTVGHSMLGQDDPVPTNSKNPVGFNWGRAQ